ncbi:glycosyltransferase family 2 protein [Marinilabiliaceae bacterium ANBcel2]|nr:glycosyltransferase family 2 protein [Marinilabiliaceae bacterium ANBcel2]
MKISLITICFNNEETIEETFKSVKNQNYPNLEYIVIDGASTDKTVDIIKREQAFISKWISEPDKGIYDALNKGIEMATGDIIGFIHGDDIFADNNVLKTVASRFNEKDKPDLIYGNLRYVKANNPDIVLRHWNSSKFSLRKCKWGWMPPHPTLYCKNKVFKKVGYFNISYKISADYEWILRAFLNHQLKAAYIPVLMIKMKTGGVSNRSFKNIMLKTKEDYRAIKEHHAGGILTLLWKNFSKLNQFCVKS